LDLQLASKNNSTLTWAALQLPQLQTLLSTELSASGLNPGSTSRLLAVLYTLSVAAPGVVAGTLAAQCPAINSIVAMVSLALVQVTASAADSAGQKWREWQNLASAIGLDSVYLPAVLSPASKATPRCFCIPATCCGQTSGTDTATFLLALTHVQRDLLLAWSCIWCLLFWTWIMPLFSKPVRTAKKAGLANTNLTHISFLPTHEYGASWLLVDQLAPICQHTCADVC